MPINVNTFNNDMATLVDDIQNSLVQLSGSRGNLGAGTIWRADGLIVTNAHVVRGDNLKVMLATGERYTARVVAVDDARDVAALAIDATGLTPVTIGDSRALRAGQWVVAVGHPYGVLGSATAGTVIGTGIGLPEYGGESEWIALNLHLRPGHSGGALVDAAGNLVGINTMITAPDVGYAVPTHVVEQVLGANAYRPAAITV